MVSENNRRQVYGKKRWPVWMGLGALFLAGLVLALHICSDRIGNTPGYVSGINYTDYYIPSFWVRFDGQEKNSVGPNVFPKEFGEPRAVSGGKCCVRIPASSHAERKVAVDWVSDKVVDGRTVPVRFRAVALVPNYGKDIYGVAVHFLPGDRIRVQVVDERGVIPSVPDRDAYVEQGVLDSELDKDAESKE